MLEKPYNDRTLKAALAAVDKYLAGKKARPPKGSDAVSKGGGLKRGFDLPVEVGDAMLELAEHDFFDLARCQSAMA